MSNNLKGRTLLLEIFDSGVWKKIGGVKTKSNSRDNPVADATSSSTPGSSNETEACFTGFATETIEASGIPDTRSGAALLAYKVLASLAHNAVPVATLRFSNALEQISGDWIITNWESSGEETDLVAFSCSFQNEGELSYS